MSATASGADAKANGSAKSREHNQGNQGKRFTDEQKAAVIRVRKCSHTSFYEILGIEKSASDGEIKKAYRKLSLLTHPDKNGYDGADEAFKMVSRAFQILSDADKKAKFDRFGGDPDSRFGAGASPSSPFSGFAQSPRGAGSSMYEEEISPEELFQRFFGGAGMGGGGFGPFGADPFGGQQFVFNLNGGPGFRVHQFGGRGPRRRPRDANQAQEEQPASWKSMLLNLLPLLIFFILPVLSSLLSTPPPVGPDIRDTATPPFTMPRTSKPRGLYKYYLNPDQVQEYTNKKFHDLDRQVEVRYVRRLQYECQEQKDEQRRLIQEAQGFFFQDTEKMNKARSLKLDSCRKLERAGLRTEDYF